jgi:hypothetical protein
MPTAMALLDVEDPCPVIEGDGELVEEAGLSEQAQTDAVQPFRKTGASERNTHAYDDFDVLIESNVAGATHSAGQLTLHRGWMQAERKRIRQREDALVGAGIDANRTGKPLASSGTQSEQDAAASSIDKEKRRRRVPL